MQYLSNIYQYFFQQEPEVDYTGIPEYVKKHIENYDNGGLTNAEKKNAVDDYKAKVDKVLFKGVKATVDKVLSKGLIDNNEQDIRLLHYELKEVVKEANDRDNNSVSGVLNHKLSVD